MMGSAALRQMLLIRLSGKLLQQKLTCSRLNCGSPLD